ncbi:hypothetical protein C8J56DRAFT_729117, partial [Mycena floridula]
FTPKNMPSADKHSHIINNYISEQIIAGRMAGGYSIEDALIFFNGHFRTAPMGVVEQNNKFRIVHNMSAIDSEGDSTNSWLDATDEPVGW